MPISFLQPALTFALVWQNGWEKWNAAYWDSLVVSAPLLIFSRTAVSALTWLREQATTCQHLPKGAMLLRLAAAPSQFCVLHHRRKA